MPKYANIEIKEELSELKILFRKSKEFQVRQVFAITYS